MERLTMNTLDIEIKITDKNIAATKYKISKIANRVSYDWLLNDVMFASVTPAQFSRIKKLNVDTKIDNKTIQTTTKY
jgi:hypothetical protein